MLARKHELVALQLTDPLEFELPKAGLVRMHDPMTGKRYSVDTSSRRVRERYRNQARKEQALIEDTMRRARVDRVEISTAGSFVDPLYRYFQQREMRKR